MNKKIQNEILESIETFRMPKFEEIPDVGLYLKQTTKYISQIYAPLQEITVTSSMISNYVKMGLITNPVKKQYNREQIAYLIFIAGTKLVLSMDNIKTLLEIQSKTYPAEAAYNYFCSDFETVLKQTFNFDAKPMEIESQIASHPELKALLRIAITTIANKIYLDKCFFHYQNESQ